MAGIFQNAVLTRKGIALIAKAQAGECKIELTKAAAGAGTHGPGEELADCEELTDKKQEFKLVTVTTQNRSTVFVKFVMTNNPEGNQLAHGYQVKELGLYANDPDDGEILYSIAVAVEGQEDYMPAYNDLLPASITIDYLTEVSNTEDVTIVMPARTYLYDEATGDKYILGVENRLVYIQKEVDS